MGQKCLCSVFSKIIKYADFDILNAFNWSKIEGKWEFFQITFVSPLITSYSCQKMQKSGIPHPDLIPLMSENPPWHEGLGIGWLLSQKSHIKSIKEVEKKVVKC